MIIEIIVTNLEEALTAQQLGANRLELIHTLDSGGLSPPLKVTEKICNKVDIPVNVMLRSNPCNNFNYSLNDIEHMLTELEFIRYNTGASGIVFGALDKLGNIDLALLKLVIANKGHLALTFHRAIDASNNILINYQQLLYIKEVDLVLTSGGALTAIEGLATISKMVALNSKRSNAKILAGSGINSQNAKHIITNTNVTQIHIGTGVRDKGVLSPTKLNELVKTLLTTFH